MSDPQAAGLGACAALVPDLLEIAVSGATHINLALLGEKALLGAVGAAGAIVVNEAWKAYKNAIKKNPNKPKQ